jgi:hypothetical protein
MPCAQQPSTHHAHLWLLLLMFAWMPLNLQGVDNGPEPRPEDFVAGDLEALPAFSMPSEMIAPMWTAPALKVIHMLPLITLVVQCTLVIYWLGTTVRKQLSSTQGGHCRVCHNGSTAMMTPP